MQVHSVLLPEDMRAAAMRSFRSSAHNIDDIRAAFRLPEERPLMAFSLKPRVGLTFDETRKITSTPCSSRTGSGRVASGEKDKRSPVTGDCHAGSAP